MNIYDYIYTVIRLHVYHFLQPSFFGYRLPFALLGTSVYAALWFIQTFLIFISATTLLQARFKKAELLLFLQRFEPEQLLFAKNGFIENDQNLKQNLPSIQIGSGDLKPENVTLSLHSEVQIKKIEPFLNNCACALILWPTGPHNDDMIRQFSKGPHKKFEGFSCHQIRYPMTHFYKGPYKLSKGVCHQMNLGLRFVCSKIKQIHIHNIYIYGALSNQIIVTGNNFQVIIGK